MNTAELRKASQAVFLATDESVAQELSTMLKGAADEIDSLRTENVKLRLVTEALVEKVEKGILSLESRGIEGHNEALFWHNLIHDLKQALKGEGNE